MTDSPCAVDALLRVDADDVVRLNEDLYLLTRQLAMVARIHTNECEHALTEDGATLSRMVASWRAANGMLAEAVRAAEALQSRASVQLRQVCRAVRASQSAAQPET